jgi:methionine aminotransferase
MSALAAEYNAINLSQGFPDFEAEFDFIETIKKNAVEKVHQYAPMSGLKSLKVTLQKIIQDQHNRTLNEENILITAGATQAIFTTIQALVGRGEEVIIIDPAYDCYAPAVQLAGGISIHIPMNDDLTLNLNKIKDKLSAKTRCIIINNPHNPTGCVIPKNTLGELVKIVLEYPNCLILSDEVYEFISFIDETVTMHQFPEIHDRLITFSSFGKTLHITGWKVGYLTAPEALMKEILKVHQFLVFSVNHFAQKVINDFLQLPVIDGLSDLYQQKRNLLQRELAASKFKLLECSGTYFQLLDYSSISDLPDVEFCKWMTKEIGVASIPTSVFYEQKIDKKQIRLCFAKSETTLINASKLLCQI